MTATALLTIVSLVAGSTVLGLAWRFRTGRVRTARAGRDSRSAAGCAEQPLDLPEVPLTGRATLLQFSTPVCAPCRPTRVLLAEIARDTPEVQHIDLDLSLRPDLASRFGILQTPTTLILDARGVIRARIGGAPRAAEVREALAQLFDNHASASSTRDIWPATSTSKIHP